MLENICDSAMLPPPTPSAPPETPVLAARVSGTECEEVGGGGGGIDGEAAEGAGLNVLPTSGAGDAGTGGGEGAGKAPRGGAARGGAEDCWPPVARLGWNEVVDKVSAVAGPH